jgi:hypothetical protein
MVLHREGEVAKVQFKTKIILARDREGNVSCYIKVPRLTTTHCDMTAFRMHRQYGKIANSDLFPDIINRDVRTLLLGNKDKNLLNLDNASNMENVTITTNGYFALVTIDL